MGRQHLLQVSTLCLVAYANKQNKILKSRVSFIPVSPISCF